MSEDWDFYFCAIEEKPASIFLNLGRAETVPDELKPALIRVSLSLLNPREDGLPEPGESPILNNIEDALVEALSDSLSAEYVGRLTWNGRREFAFYAGSATLLDVYLQNLSREFSDYEFEFGEQEDADWEFYQEFLYPNPLEWQQVMNRRLLRQLEEHGNVNEIERQVDHAAIFPNAAAAKPFVKKAKEKGFELNAEHRNEDHFVVELIRTHDTKPQTIDDIVTDLFILADEYGGWYDGWGCSIETEDEA